MPRTRPRFIDDGAEFVYLLRPLYRISFCSAATDDESDWIAPEIDNLELVVVLRH